MSSRSIMNHIVYNIYHSYEMFCFRTKSRLEVPAHMFTRSRWVSPSYSLWRLRSIQIVLASKCITFYSPLGVEDLSHVMIPA